MTLTERQIEVCNNLPGFHLNAGEPCECGVEHVSTRKKYGYSDSLVFYHRCTECGNKFSTWIEG